MRSRCGLYCDQESLEVLRAGAAQGKCGCKKVCAAGVFLHVRVAKRMRIAGHAGAQACMSRRRCICCAELCPCHAARCADIHNLAQAAGVWLSCGAVRRIQHLGAHAIPVTELGVYAPMARWSLAVASACLTVVDRASRKFYPNVAIAA